MGLYDTLANDEQVKCFYKIGFWHDAVTQGENGFGNTIHIGGGMRFFSLGDKVPIRTKYYIYPKDFCIFDYHAITWEIPSVHMFVKGRYLRYVDMAAINENDIMPFCINRYGEQLAITCVNDVFEIASDYAKKGEVSIELRKKYDTMSAINYAREVINDPPEFNKRIAYAKELAIKLNSELASHNYMDRWIVRDGNSAVKQMGEFWAVYDREKKRINDPGDISEADSENFVQIKKAFANFLVKSSRIVDQYCEWQSLSVAEKIALKKVVAEVLCE